MVAVGGKPWPQSRDRTKTEEKAASTVPQPPRLPHSRVLRASTVPTAHARSTGDQRNLADPLEAKQHDATGRGLDYENATIDTLAGQNVSEN